MDFRKAGRKILKGAGRALGAFGAAVEAPKLYESLKKYQCGEN
jgi:hypothetical protein